MPVVEGVRRASPTGTGTATAQFSVATNGSLVYVPGPARQTGGAGNLRLGIYDGKGGIEPLNMPLGLYQAGRVSRATGGPSHSRTATTPPSTSGCWTSMARAPLVALPSAVRIARPSGRPMANGSHSRSDREGDLAIYRQRADGSATAERLTKPEKGIVHIPQSWSPDGAQLLFSVGNNREYTLQTMALPTGKPARFPTSDRCFRPRRPFLPTAAGLSTRLASERDRA